MLQKNSTTTPSQESQIITQQLIDHLKSMGINVHNREEMIHYLNEHGYNSIQEAIKPYYIKISDNEEIEILRKDLFAKFNNHSSYGCIGHTANYWYLCDYFGDSTYKIRAQILIDGNESLINAFENEIKNETFRSPEDFSRRFEAFKSGQGQHYNGGTDASIRITDSPDVRLAESKLQKGNLSNTETSDGYGTKDNAGTGLTNSLANNWNDDFQKALQLFTTPQGEIYGFVASNGDMYLDETVVSPEHPIHEYTHLWDRALANNNPKLWQRGIELMKQTSLWKDIEESDNYGKKWKALNGMTNKKLESLIASEVHARLEGENGERKTIISLAEQRF